MRAGSKQAPAGWSVSCRGPGATGGGACVLPVTSRLCLVCAWGAWCGSDGAALATVYCIPSWIPVGLFCIATRVPGQNTQRGPEEECNEEEQEQNSRAAVDGFCVERAESGLVEGGPPFLRVRIEIGPSAVDRMNELGARGRGLREKR